MRREVETQHMVNLRLLYIGIQATRAPIQALETLFAQ